MRVNSARSIPIRRPGKRFARAIGRLVARPLPEGRRALNLQAKGGFEMRRRIHLMALGIAITVNVAALMVVNAAMLDGAERERLSQQEPERIVITGDRKSTRLNSSHVSIS